MTVELRHLRVLLAIIDAGNLSRAATQLHVSQPALSRTLSQLEHLVGAQLIERSTHHCRATPSGLQLANAAKAALRTLDDGVAAASGRHRPLLLGHSWSAGGYLAAIMRTWHRVQRPCALELVKVDSGIASLRDHTTDAVIIRGEISANDITCMLLGHEKRVVALPNDHRLAARRSLKLADLSGETVISTTVGTTSPTLWDERDRPTFTTPLTNVEDWLASIAAGIGIGVSVTATAELHSHPGIRYRPLSDAPTVSVHLAHLRRGAHPACPLLAEIAQTSGRSLFDSRPSKVD
jgi:DNA-binding transcriptional LysR family regulator